MMSQGWSEAGNPLLKVHSHDHEKGSSLSFRCTIQLALCELFTAAQLDWLASLPSE